jgi:TonB-linked SusC/RagA family outer membrane protein
MTEQMKYKLRFILCAVFAFTCFVAGAQTVAMDEADSQAANEQVQVAFRQVAPLDLLGGVSVLNMEELTDKNYENEFNMGNLQGYVSGFNGTSLWGMDADNAVGGLQGYLVLIDGVPRDNNNVLPTEVDQITFLKGAQAVVLYGSQAAKGAIYVTTKRGRTEGLSVNVRANTGFYVSKSYPEYLGSAEYMQLYNEARANDGLTAAYTQEDLYNYNSGKNPYRYADVDFYSSDYLRKAYNRSDITAEIEGGGERAKFYSNINYYRAGDRFKVGEAQNNSISRLGFRGNVDMKISDMIHAYANTSATFYDSKSARGANYWESAANLRPNRVNPLIPIELVDQNSTVAWDYINNTNLIDGKYILGGTSLDQTNVFADMYAAGKSKYTSRQFQFDTGVKMDLGGVLEGLSFDAKFAVDYATSYTTSFDNSYSTFAADWASFNGPEMIAGLTMYGTDRKTGQQSLSNSSDRQTMLLNAQFNYQNTFNDVHNVSAMLLASGWQRTFTGSGSYHKPSSANAGLQLGYNYDHRYYVDASVALVHSAKLPEGGRNALSPSVTLGWRLSEEGFLKDSSVVDDLVLSVSGSILNEDIDINGYYLHQSSWGQTYGWGWFSGNENQYTISQRGENKEMTFIQRKEVSATLRTSLWDRLITAEASFFMNRMDGYLVEPLLFPSYMSTGYPAQSFITNINNDQKDRVGFDFGVNLNKRFGQVDLSLGVVGTYYDTKWAKHEDDGTYADSYQYRTGRPLDAIWGLESEGLFQSEEEIAAAPSQAFGGTLRPGDIRYKDQNGDNVIDTKDEVYLGKNGAYGSPLTLGMNLTLKWKGLTFFALATAGSGGYGMKNGSYYWVAGDTKYSAAVRDRWTPETAATATYPRLTTENGANNFRNSDFWLYKNNRIDLAKVQITYDLPKHLLQDALLKDLSIYVSGTNLLTISKERQHMEMNVGGAPRTRFYNVGVRAMF